MAYRETEARKRIFQCALQRVMEGGFRNAQITHVAQAAGVATGTIYRYFDSKEELFAEIFRNATQREVAEALAIGGNAVTRLEAALRQFAERARYHRRKPARAVPAWWAPSPKALWALCPRCRRNRIKQTAPTNSNRWSIQLSAFAYRG